MPKRTFWTTVGYGAGIASSMYVQRRVRKAVRKVAPVEVRNAAAAKGSAAVAKVRTAGGTVANAVRDGRAAMRDTEAELRDQYSPPPR